MGLGGCVDGAVSTMDWDVFTMLVVFGIMESSGLTLGRSERPKKEPERTGGQVKLLLADNDVMPPKPVHWYSFIFISFFFTLAKCLRGKESVASCR